MFAAATSPGLSAVRQKEIGELYDAAYEAAGTVHSLAHSAANPMEYPSSKEGIATPRLKVR